MATPTRRTLTDERPQSPGDEAFTPLERVDLDRTRLVVNGGWVAALSTETVDSLEAATGLALGCARWIVLPTSMPPRRLHVMLDHGRGGGPLPPSVPSTCTGLPRRSRPDRSRPASWSARRMACRSGCRPRWSKNPSTSVQTRSKTEPCRQAACAGPRPELADCRAGQARSGTRSFRARLLRCAAVVGGGAAIEAGIPTIVALAEIRQGVPGRGRR